MSLLKGALNERDSWEKAAAAHERLHFPPSSQSSAMPTRRSRRLGGSRGAGSSTGMNPTNRMDLTIRPPAPMIPTSVPKQVSNKVAWDTVKVSSSITVSTSGISETNFNFNLSQHPQASSWQALYDQWCIPQASVTFNSQYPSNANFAPAQLVTALDFDNSTNLSSISLLEDFSTCNQQMLAEGVIHTRSVKPCVKTQLGTTANSGLGRTWCDCSVSTTPWYGIRSIIGVSGGNYFVTVTYQIWFAFRNQI